MSAEPLQLTGPLQAYLQSVAVRESPVAARLREEPAPCRSPSCRSRPNRRL